MRHIAIFVLASLLLSTNVEAERAPKTDIKGVRLGEASINAQKSAGNCVSSPSSSRIYVCNGAQGDSFTLGETHYREPPVVDIINYSFCTQLDQKDVEAAVARDFGLDRIKANEGQSYGGHYFIILNQVGIGCGNDYTSFKYTLYINDQKIIMEDRPPARAPTPPLKF